MTLPLKPSFNQMPNNFRQLFDLKNKGLINLTKTTKLTAKRVKDVAKTANDIKKTAKNAKEVTDNLKKGNFKKVNGGMANAIGFALSLASIGLNLLTINHIGNLQEIQLRKEGIIENDLNVSFQNFVKNTLTIRKLREEFNKFKNRYDEDKGRLLNQVQESFTNSVSARELAEKAKKQANDALYEVRQGRKKLEAKISEIKSEIQNGLQELVNDIANQNNELNTRIEEARKLGNDALYEVREGRRKLEIEINRKFQEARKPGNDALYEVRQNRLKIESNLNAKINDQLQRVESRLQQQSRQLFEKSQSIVNNALSQARAAQAQTRSLQQRLSQIQSDLSRLNQGVRNPQLNIDARVRQLLASSPQIQSLFAALKAANVDISGFKLQLPALDTAIKTVGYKAELIDGRVTKLEKDIKLKDPGITRLDNRISHLDTRININKNEIDKLKLNTNTNKKLDNKQYNNLLQKIALIPPLVARVPDNTIKRMPRPLTQPQIEAATGKAMCKSTAPGGCMNKGLRDVTNNVNNNTNNWGKNLLDKINAGANAAQLALLKVINNKLGKQIAGGISGGVVKNLERINKFADWLRIDRVLNIMTWVNTTHNAYMLSSSITNTLFGAIDNVANIFFKDINGVDIDSKKAVSSYFNNMAKAIFGVEQWNNITTTMKKYNRIYQAGANIINSVRSITDSIRNVTEYIAENTGKIGNALMKFGAIASNAFPKMPEQVNASSVWLQRLENLEEAASGIESITGEVLGITENLNEIKKQTEEFNKSVEDLEPKVRKDNKPVKEREELEIAESQSPFISPEKERSA